MAVTVTVTTIFLSAYLVTFIKTYNKCTHTHISTYKQKEVETVVYILFSLLTPTAFVAFSNTLLNGGTINWAHRFEWADNAIRFYGLNCVNWASFSMLFRKYTI